MGHGCYTDIVPYVLHHAWEGPDSRLFEKEELLKLLVPEIWVEEFGEISDDTDFTEEILKVEIGGWKHEGTADLGKRNRLFATKISNGNFSVYLLNESQYSNGGDYDIAIIANDEESIKAFMADFGGLMSDYARNRATIEKDDTASMWC